MPKGNPPIRIQKALYDAWLAENPKSVEGGPMQVEQDNGSNNPDMIILPSHHVESDTLPDEYADNLMIFGYSNQFEGFKVWVTPKGFDYLLMAHHRHYSGTFKDQNGALYKNHPHFHELEIDQSRTKANPSTRRVVTSQLKPNMPAIGFLEEFLDHYYFDDGRKGNLKAPIKNNGVQGKLNDWS